ncbi:MAG TPA: CHRD domain-containing protein [Thermoanaerobaculia bacterium]|nr:CHRD domain-containing protein [Thermoanaerobaculia bacterium]
MKRLLVFCCLALLAVTAAAQSYTAAMTGDVEVPNPGDPDGVGVALITIDGTTVHYSIVTQNIGPAIGAHIHRGAAGVPGPVVIGFDLSMLTNGSVEGVPQSLIDEIVANPAGFYLNVHTSAFPGGAVRAQLVPLGGAATGAQFLPVAGKGAGAGGTNFVTDVRFINRGSAAATVTLDYFQQSLSGHASTSPTATATIMVAPGEQTVLDDVIGFLGSSGLGSLRVTSTANVDVLARVLNDRRATGEGTTGFAMDAGTLGDAGLAGSLGFLSMSSIDDINAGAGFRTNIGYFNPNDHPVTATFTAHSSEDGSALGSRTITIPGFSFAQQGAFELITGVPAGDQVQPNFYVTWTSTDGPLFVYGAVLDNKTGDSVVVQ